MQAILMSIQPKWVELIANGKKTIEIRKSMPKCKLPIDVYIYETLGKQVLIKTFDEWGNKYPNFYGNDFVPQYVSEGIGKVVGKFTLEKVEELEYFDLQNEGVRGYMPKGSNGNLHILKKCCMDIQELLNYGKPYKSLYAWHITDLVIFDKPKELGEFYKPNQDIKAIRDLEEELCENCPMTDYGTEKINTGPYNLYEGYACEKAYKEYLENFDVIIKAPQSWCYVEVQE